MRRAAGARCGWPALAAADLIDEHRLLVQPLVMGRGQALFDQLPESRHLDLIDTVPFPSASSYTSTNPAHRNDIPTGIDRVEEALRNAQKATDELRELVSGILPAALTRSG